MDTLENGSGYRRHPSDPRSPREHLAAVTRKDSGWVAKVAGREHADACGGSCYDGLRDDSSADLHAVLDRRLAPDLAELAADAKADIAAGNGRGEDLAHRAEATLREVAPGRTFGLAHPRIRSRHARSSTLDPIPAGEPRVLLDDEARLPASPGAQGNGVRGRLRPIPGRPDTNRCGV